MKAAGAGIVPRLAFVMACVPALPSAAIAGTAYVTDELVLNVYSQENSEGRRLATLRSGAVLETVTESGESTQVRLPDGRIGWVKTSYLTTQPPAAARLKQLQDELDHRRAATPAGADAAPAQVMAGQSAAGQAAARAEIERLTRELAAAKERREESHAIGAAAGPAAVGGSGVAPPPATPSAGAVGVAPAVVAAAAVVAATLGYWLGYAALARRVRAKFGGIKVY